MDAYSDVKATVQSSDTLCFHIVKTWRRIRELQAGKRVSLKYIRKQLGAVYGYHVNLEDLSEQGLDIQWGANEVSSVEEFQRHVPGLGEVQAERLMEMAVRSWRLTNETALTLYDVRNHSNQMLGFLFKKINEMG